MAVFKAQGVVTSETDKGVYKDMASVRVYLQKKDMTMRIKFYDLETVHYIPKDSKMYNDLMRDLFSNEME
ncbi:hypothetical protein MKZ25_05785 [Solibacillus sp. FSL W7-1464]|uniref:hypothetical protein n=1 Tax=Solibacillus sp. FSL W7-1464 TaxID=2921706 RepID=UPI0030FC8FD2